MKCTTCGQDELWHGRNSKVGHPFKKKKVNMMAVSRARSKARHPSNGWKGDW